MTQKSAYAVLGVEKDASEEDVKKAYIELVKKFDPEKHTDRYIVIQKAYSTLNDPRKRAVEDIFTFNKISGHFAFSDEEKTIGPDEDLDAEYESIRERQDELASDEDLRRRLVTVLMKRSCAHVKARAWKEAIGDWKLLLKVDPTNSRAKNNLTYALIQVGYQYASHELYDEAAKAWEAALKLNPDNPKVLHNLALAFEKSDNKEKAEKFWRQVIRYWEEAHEKSPEDAYLKERLIEAYRFQGDQAMDGTQGSQAAQREYSEALRIDPNDFKAQYQMAVTMMNERRFDEAVERLKVLSARHPKNTEVLNLLGWAYINNNNHERGFQAWRRSLGIDPNNTETKQNIINARMQLARSLRSRNQFTYALVHYKELQRLLPNSEEVQIEIAETFKLKGDKRSAEREFRRAIKMNPANKAALKGLAEIRMGT